MSGGSKKKPVFFSLFVPTRDRVRTLKGCLECLLNIDYAHYEIVVMDNAGPVEVKELVDSFGSEKIRYFRSDDLLSMADNFERALSHCDGDYIAGIGDDDGLTPSSLKVMNQIIRETEADLIKIGMHQYHWDDSLFDSLSNMLFTGTLEDAAWKPSKQVLAEFYQSSRYAILPSIYKGFVSMDLVDRVKKDHGRYFLCKVPDIDSGIVNTVYSERFLEVKLPIAVNGDSGKSTGGAHFFRSKGKKRVKEWVSENKDKSQADSILPELIPSPNVAVVVADTMLRMKRILFENDKQLTLSIGGVLNAMTHNLQYDPSSYDDNLKDIKKLAAKHGFSTENARIPSKKEVVRAYTSGKDSRNRGICTLPEGKSNLVVDGRIAGLQNIAQAALLAEACTEDLEKAWQRIAKGIVI